MKNTIEMEIKSYLEELNGSEVLSIVREINSYNGALESLTWESMEDFDELCGNMKPWEVARACYFGDFNPTHKFFRWNAYGNFESTDYLEFDSYDFDEIVETCSDMPYSYLPTEIQFIYDEFEEEENEEED